MNVINALDLDPIKVKLMHKESGEGWSLERANAVEFEYRRFLTLMKKYPHEQTSPLVDVDTFWHYHILDTMKYAADCEAVLATSCTTSRTSACAARKTKRRWRALGSA